MGLLSIFQRKSGDKSKTPATPTSADAVQDARIRARRRLIGAAVLVVIGVIGFPILFETQPRPIPVDIPIEIPRRENAPPLTMPAARPAKPVATAPVEPAAPASAAVITETQADAGREVPEPPPKPAPAPKSAETVATKPQEPVATKPSPAAKPAAATATNTAAQEGQRAQALLEGKPAKEGAGRYIVQVGAFADASAARETRQKVEKLGLKTYTQVAETSAGSRIRVRVGPFASREEADRAVAKIKAAGTAAVVLTL